MEELMLLGEHSRIVSSVSICLNNTSYLSKEITLKSLSMPHIRL